MVPETLLNFVSVNTCDPVKDKRRGRLVTGPGVPEPILHMKQVRDRGHGISSVGSIKSKEFFFLRF